ncbi:MAG TPA: uracil-DNA glycosylase [Candidatus Eisenbacteria bacterium]|jgi:uracil-DNA glycosylase family 4|nr:uracil-DNA glycosylase [Candidatus Eisenbacteria bacterium]
MSPRDASADTLARIAADVVGCERCPRLRRYCEEVARTRRAAFRDQVYWGRPVPGFGDPLAWLLVIGLAPAAHGGNRTGRVFTGDKSGEWLYGELFRQGLASQAESVSRDDGMRLRGAYVTAALRCAPPGNRPLPVEAERCREYLVREMRALRNVRVRLVLGRIGFEAFLRARRALELDELTPKKPAFGHGVAHPLPEGGWLLCSYHPSQQNTSTGVLTRAMWQEVFDTASRLRDRV